MAVFALDLAVFGMPGIVSLELTVGVGPRLQCPPSQFQRNANLARLCTTPRSAFSCADGTVGLEPGGGYAICCLRWGEAFKLDELVDESATECHSVRLYAASCPVGDA